MIHYSKAFKALDNYVNRYNAIASNGTKKLKTATVATAKEIIRIYGAELFAKQKEQLPCPSPLPSLKTNNQQLATMLKCSPRSIQRHILKLQAAGVITGKAFHGTKADYELWINPGILNIKQQLPVNSCATVLKTGPANKSITQVNPYFFCAQEPNCRHTYTGNLNNNILNEVDNDNNLKNDSSENIEDGIQKEKNSGNKSSAAAGVGADFVQGDQLQTNADVLNMFINLFWLTAKNMLYKYTSITSRQEKTARLLIGNLYRNQKEQDIQKLHDSFILRLKLAADYVQKDPVKRFIPLPYIYFDPNNSKGFAGTEEWYCQSKKYRADIDRDLLLEHLIHRYKNNERMPMSKRRPPLQLYKAYEKQLEAYKDEELLHKFYRAVLDHHGVQS